VVLISTGVQVLVASRLASLIRIGSATLLLLFPLLTKAETIDFSLPDLNGVERKLSEFRGKWVVLNYWATWCPPCLKEIPELVEFHEQHQDKNAVVVGVDFEDIPRDELVEFTESYFMSYPILMTKPTAKTPVGVISGLPTTFLISPEGKLVARQSGPVTAEMIEEFINQQSNP
jgi:thiol-disulfide isomerase/thioredoxin